MNPANDDQTGLTILGRKSENESGPSENGSGSSVIVGRVNRGVGRMKIGVGRVKTGLGRVKTGFGQVKMEVDSWTVMICDKSMGLVDAEPATCEEYQSNQPQMQL